jgi:hypothetical protein
MMLGRPMHTAEPSVPEPSPSEVQSATEKLNKYIYIYKSTRTDQVPTEMSQAKSKR